MYPLCPELCLSSGYGALAIEMSVRCLCVVVRVDAYRSTDEFGHSIGFQKSYVPCRSLADASVSRDPELEFCRRGDGEPEPSFRSPCSMA